MLWRTKSIDDQPRIKNAWLLNREVAPKKVITHYGDLYPLDQQTDGLSIFVIIPSNYLKCAIYLVSQ